MYALPVKHRVLLQVTYTDSTGAAPATKSDNETPRPPDPRVVRWAVSGSYVDIKPDPADVTKCYITGRGLGRSQVRATTDADPGAQVRQLVTVFDVEVVESVTGTIAPVGEPAPV